MKKIKFQFKEIKNKIVKIQKQKVQIKPYISAIDALDISNILLKQSFIDIDNFVVLRYLYDILVLYKCTNIKIDGISTSKENDKNIISLDIDDNLLEYFDKIRIINYIKPYILNYDEIYFDICKCIEIKNSKNIFDNVDINPNEFDKAIKESLKSLTEFKEKDPETFKQILGHSLENNIKKQTLNEIKENKKQTKKKREIVYGVSI